MTITAEQEQQLVGEIDRGAKARAILESPLFAQALEVIEADTLEKWKESPIRDVEGREKLRLKWQVIQEFKEQFAETIRTGRLAEIGLERERSLAKRVKDMAVRTLRRV